MQRGLGLALGGKPLEHLRRDASGGHGTDRRTQHKLLDLRRLCCCNQTFGRRQVDSAKPTTVDIATAERAHHGRDAREGRTEVVVDGVGDDDVRVFAEVGVGALAVAGEHSHGGAAFLQELGDVAARPASATDDQDMGALWSRHVREVNKRAWTWQLRALGGVSRRGRAGRGVRFHWRGSASQRGSVAGDGCCQAADACC